MSTTDRRRQDRGKRERAPLPPLTPEERKTWQDQQQGALPESRWSCYGPGTEGDLIA